MIQGIRHIIFDLGGVLLNIEFGLTETAFKKLGIRKEKVLYSALQQNSLFDDLETGTIGTAEFIHGLKAAGATDADDQEIIDAWNELILDFPLRRLQILQQLQLHYDLVLLSNTNEIHEPFFNKVLQKDHGIPNIGVFFDRVYYSHRVGLRKPDPRIFELVMQECGFAPAHTLFIDDNEHNIKTAESLGIRSIWLKSGMSIEQDIFLSPDNKTIKE